MQAGQAPRGSFTLTQKLELLAQYEDACTRDEGGAFLRGQGLHSSQITEWRKLRDAGVLQARRPGDHRETVPRPGGDRASAPQTEGEREPV